MQKYLERKHSEFLELEIGEMKYWNKDSPLEDTNLVNRTFVDDSRKEK